MTKEQIKALKKGDKFRIEYRITDVTEDTVDAKYDASLLFTRFEKDKSETLQTATLVTPPPTFEVGDTVRIVPDPLTGHAHCHVLLWDGYIGKEGIIDEIDTETGLVVINSIDKIDIHCLELVKKAVKEKYRVEETFASWTVCCETGWVASYRKKYNTTARAAAETECARLNAEWRKQQESAAVCDSGETKGGAE